MIEPDHVTKLRDDLWNLTKVTEKITIDSEVLCVVLSHDKLLADAYQKSLDEIKRLRSCLAIGLDFGSTVEPLENFTKINPSDSTP